MYRFSAVLLVLSMITVYQVYCRSSTCYKGPVITRITGINEHSEGPHWHPQQRALYFVDIAGHAVHRYSILDNSDRKVVLNDTVSFVIPILDNPNDLIIGLGRHLAILKWNGESTDYKLRTIATVDAANPGNRFNDAKADAIGRLWAGTMGKEEPVGTVEPNVGSLYSWDAERCKVKRVVSPVSISNGIAWDTDNSIMYYIDTPTRNISAFDYSIYNGKLSNKRTVFSFNKIPGNPDGMTVDIDGNLWIACWGGSRVINIDPRNGRLLRTIHMPVERVTSVTFGGHHMKTLFVTTMRSGLNAAQLIDQPEAGAVFKVTNLGVQGSDNMPAFILC